MPASSESQESDYHTYEAIGKGKFSTVYKARRKRSIQYYAMKSVEKSQRARIMHEVQVMRALSHENILKFVSCYQTSAHFWLILEYCVGGDLLTLLSQDVKLPESSIMIFARDMFVAAREIHGAGFIHCDLKPSNMLLDEEGRVKVCGLGLSQKISAITTSSGTPTQLSSRGTPCYMAPEMFTPEGVHSYATDLWALGCVLYECATGRPPFTSSSLTSLIEQILGQEPAPLPPSCSSSFRNLVFGLLVKRPHTRLTWDQVIQHEFWTEHRGKFLDDIRDLATLKLPSQPAFEALADKLKREDLAMRLRMMGSVRESAAPSVRDSVMPLLTQSLRDGVNVLRLSRIARSNMEREEVGSYGPNGGSGTGEDDAPPTSSTHDDVELDNPDAELNFTAPSGDKDLEMDADSDEVEIPVAATTPPRKRGGDDAYGDENKDENVASGDASTSDSDEATRIMLMPPEGKAMLVDSRSPVSATRSMQTADDDFEDASSSFQSAETRPAETPAAPDAPTERRRPATFGVNDETPPPIDFKVFKDLCHHASDITVRPIVSNHRIEVVQDAPHDAEKLPFKDLSVDEMLATSTSELEAFLTRIYRSVAHPSNVQEKVNTLAYFETLCTEVSSANVLANSSLMSMFVRVLASSRSAPLKIKLCSILGLLMRHATHISDEFAKSDAAKVLAETMSDENSKVRRRAMAALGELLFYVATQKRPDAPQVWGITDRVVDVFIDTLEREEDEITKHYACKSIENIVSHESSTWIREAFAECRVASILFSIATDRQVDDQLCGTAASALARIVRLEPKILQPLVGEVDCAKCEGAREGLLYMLRHRERKVQQAGLNVLCRALVDEKSRLIGSIMHANVLLPVLSALYERSPTPIIKAKALLALALLIRAHPKWLQELCKARVLPNLDRQPTRMDPYLEKCFDAFVVTIVTLVPTVNDGILNPIKAALSSSSSKLTRQPPALELFPVLIHLLQSTLMRPKILNRAFVVSIANYIRYAESERDFPGRAELRVGVVALLETCAECAAELLHKVDALTKHLLPALCELLEECDDLETRFLALKLIYELLVPLRMDLDIATRAGADKKVIAHQLDDILMNVLFPMCPALIDSEDPIPLYALKLLSGTVTFDPALCREIIALGLAPRFFDFLSLEHTNNNEHNIHLCLALARCKALSTASLYEYDAPRKVAAVCAYTHDRNVTQFVSPALGIAAVLLRRARASLPDAAREPPRELLPILDIAPILRRLTTGIDDGALAVDLIHSLDAFNAH
jgi:serine/threonine-protein kinase ULK4